MQKSIVTDLNRCVGCLACSVACKALNDVQIGNFWNRVVRVGPNPKFEGADYPDVYMYFLPVTCQHCENAPCVAVCPTGASTKTDDGTIQIDHEQCIGCGACLDACPYGVRYINAETNVAEKCTMCNSNINDDGVPQCVSQCSGNARWYGDLEKGFEDFVGAYDTDGDYGGARRRMMDFIEPFADEDVHTLPDFGNGPSFRYILRDHTWYGAEGGVEGATMAAGSEE